LEVIELDVASLIFDPSNARTHDEKNMQTIKGSFAKFKQQIPILIDDNNVVIAGNGRLQAAMDMGWDKIKCIRSDLKTNTDKTAYALADNRSSELAAWNMDVMGEQLQSLREDGFEIEDIGFDPKDFEIKELDIDGAKELDASDFDNFGHQCPKCGFEWDDNKSSSNGPLEPDGSEIG